MASAHDVAAYLRQRGALGAIRLQKLLYYAQAWSIAWDDAPLFSESIKAWDMGPVVGEIWYAERNGLLTGDAQRLTHTERETIDGVLAWYGTRSDGWLSELSHREGPWRDVFVKGARPSPTISLDAMRAFYGAIPRDAGKTIPLEYQRGAELLMRLSPEELADLADTSTTELTPEGLATLLSSQGDCSWPES
ncbi:MAG: DUF4065 domain-containing protein [Polyangiales bacterium]